MFIYPIFNHLKLLLLLCLISLFFGAYISPSFSFAACEFLSEDFASSKGWTALQKTGDWVVKDGKLNVSGVGTTSSYATTDFFPSKSFSVDVDIDIVSASSNHDRVGTRVYAGGDVFFAVQGDGQEYTTNGVLCYYYPVAHELKFKVYDVLAGEWVVPLSAKAISGSVRSIGLSMVNDGVIFRVNGQDTNYKISGDLSNGHSFLSKFRLFAGGTGLQARFDNICASAYSGTNPNTSSSMPLPSGQQSLTTSPASAPVINADPSKANPFGFGSAASGGSTLSLSFGLSQQASPVDLYVAMQSSVLGPELYLFTGLNQLQPSSVVGLVPWKTNTLGNFQNRLLSDLPASVLPNGTYYFFLLSTPAGSLNSFRLWATPLVINTGQSNVSDKEMQQEIKNTIDLIFGLSSGFSGGLSEITSIFNNQEVITTSPSELDLTSLLAGTPITMNVDFGSGYTLESGSVMKGSAQMQVKNVIFNSRNMGADFSGTFNNILKDGLPIANGLVNGNILLSQSSGGSADISGQINFDNLTISGQKQSGTIQLSGTLNNFSLTSTSGITGDVRMTFSNFTSGSYTINSGYVDLIMNQSDSANVITNLQTGEGPVNLNIQIKNNPNSVTLNSNTPGTAGPYNITISNVTLNQDACPNYPTGGTISFTKKSTGTTGIVKFNSACDGSYGYSEQ